MTTKKCRQCGKVKPLSEYTRNTPEGTTVKTKCKECLAAAATAVRWAHNPKKPPFTFDPILDYFMAVHAREALKCRQQSIVMGPVITATLEKTDDYLIEEYHTRAHATRPLFGHPTGVRYD